MHFILSLRAVRLHGCIAAGLLQSHLSCRVHNEYASWETLSQTLARGIDLLGVEKKCCRKM
eukprot:3193026-Amphidinium_carterae.1